MSIQQIGSVNGPAASEPKPVVTQKEAPKSSSKQEATQSSNETANQVNRARDQATRDAEKTKSVKATMRTLKALGLIDKIDPLRSSSARKIAKRRKENIRYLNQFFARPGDRGKPSPFQQRYIATMRQTFKVDGNVDEAHLTARAQDAERQFVARWDKHPTLNERLMCPDHDRKILSNKLSTAEKQKITEQRLAQARKKGDWEYNKARFRCALLKLKNLTPEERSATIRDRLKEDHQDLCGMFDDFICRHTREGKRTTALRYPHLTKVFDFGEQNTSPVLYRQALRSRMRTSGADDPDIGPLSQWVCGAQGRASGNQDSALEQLTKCDLALTNKDVKQDSLQNRAYLENKIAELRKLRTENDKLILKGQNLSVSKADASFRNAFVAELQDRNQAVDALVRQLEGLLDNNSIACNLWTLNQQTALHVLTKHAEELIRNPDKLSGNADELSVNSEELSVNSEELSVNSDDRRFTLTLTQRQQDGLRVLAEAIEELQQEQAFPGYDVKNLDIPDVKRLTNKRKEEMWRWVNKQLNQQVVRDAYKSLGKKPPKKLSKGDWRAVEKEVRSRDDYPKETVRRSLVANKRALHSQFSTETRPACQSKTAVAEGYRKGKPRRAHAPNLLLHHVWGPKGQVLSRSVGVDNLHSVKFDRSGRPSKIHQQQWREVLNLAFEEHWKHGRVRPEKMVHVDVRLSKQGDDTSEVAARLRGRHEFRYKDGGKVGTVKQARVNVSPICFNFAVDNLGKTERERRNTENMTRLVGPLDTVGDLGGEIGKAIKRCQKKLDGLQDNRKAKALRKQIRLLKKQGKAIRQMFREGRHKTGRSQAYAMSTAVLSLVSTASKVELAAGNRGTAFTSSHGGSVEQASYLRCQLTARTIHGAMGMSPRNPDGQAITLWALALGDGNDVGSWQNGHSPFKQTSDIADLPFYDEHSLDRY